VPDVSNKGLLVLVNQLADGALQVTVLNFSDQDIAGSIQSSHLVPGATVHDLFSGEDISQVDDLCSFFLELRPFQGTALLLKDPVEEEVTE